MPGYNLKNRTDVDKILKLIDDPTRKKRPMAGPAMAEAITKAWCFKTPVGGIAARSGTTCSSAECTPYYIDPDGELTELLDNNQNSQTVEVFHIFESDDVGAEVYVLCVEVYGFLVVSAEDCA